jgi:hypothetical protein
MANVANISAGASHAMALLSDGNVVAIGCPRDPATQIPADVLVGGWMSASVAKCQAICLIQDAGKPSVLTIAGGCNRPSKGCGGQVHGCALLFGSVGRLQWR